MSTTYAYSYVVLRYVHDTTTGEFINVGVAIFAPETRYAGALCRPTYGRLSKTFPGINHEHFKALMRNIQAQFERIGTELQEQLSLSEVNSVLDLVERVLPNDDSSLQWSSMGSGRSADLAATLDELFDRMVMRYEDHTAPERRVEEDVWRNFKRTLETRQLLRYFEPKTIEVADDVLEFKHTWKNGMLHCLEPVSFDLASAESIRDKAHRWLGRITSVAGTGGERFQMYFLVGAPQDETLTGAYQNALSILRKVPVEKKIFNEQQVDEFGKILAQEVQRHRDGIS